MKNNLMLICYILLIGVHGFLVKLCLKHIDYRIGIMCAWGVAFVILFSTQVIPAIVQGAFKVNNKWTWIALFPGVLAGIATFLMYKIIQDNEGSKVFPLMHLTFVIATVLSLIFLKEKLTVKKVAGIVCAILTGYFLMF